MNIKNKILVAFSLALAITTAAYSAMPAYGGGVVGWVDFDTSGYVSYQGKINLVSPNGHHRSQEVVEKNTMGRCISTLNTKIITHRFPSWTVESIEYCRKIYR